MQPMIRFRCYLGFESFIGMIQQGLAINNNEEKRVNTQFNYCLLL